MAERLKDMSGEGDVVTEGSTATLAPPPEGARSVGQEPLSAEEVIKEAESILRSPQQTGTSIIPENVTTPNQQAAEQQLETTDLRDQDTIDREVLARLAGLYPPPPDGGGGEGGGRGPEDPGNPDYLWGPEFRRIGITIARELFNLEALIYQDKYDPQQHPPRNPRNGTRLGELYKDWKDWVSQNRRRAFNRKPFDPSIFTQAERALGRVEPIRPQDLTDLESPKNLLETYNGLRVHPEATDEDIRRVEGELSRYFLEAKRLGLLTGIDSSLGSIYVDIMRGVYTQEGREGRGIVRRFSADELWAKVEERIEAISKLGARSFQALRRSNRQLSQEIAQLDGIWDVYAELAKDRFALLLNGGGLVGPATIAGEFNFEPRNVQELRQSLPSDENLRERAGGNTDELKRLTKERDEWFSRNREVIDALDREIYREMSEDQELYWRPTWSSYFEVTARTPEQFDIAVETFIQWIRSGLTKSPQELFQRVNGFIDALTTAGQRERANVPPPHIRAKNLELRGLIAFLGGNFANEHYNTPNLKQFLEWGAQDEGPERYVTAGKANRGKVANVLWKFDNDPRFELFFSPHGSRGQLMAERNPIEMEQLQEQIMNMLILETMAAEIKGYHPDDPEKRLDGRYLEENLAEAVNFIPDEDFKNLYDGFDQTIQDDIYQELFQKQVLLNRAQELQRQVNEGLPPADLVEADRTIYELLIQGQLGLKKAEAEYLERLIRVQRMQDDYAAGRFDSKALRGEERRMYDEANNAVTLAYEMYGVMGEKAKRGGGVYIVDKKNPDGTLKKDAEGLPVVDYLPANKAEKVEHFVENWVKATYGVSGEDLDPQIRAKLIAERRVAGEAQLENPNLSAAERRKIEAWMNPQGIFADELKYRVDQARRMAIWAQKTYGFDAKFWDFTLLRDGKPIDPNTLGYVKDSFGEPYGINRRAENDIEKYRYCVPENPMILGYNSKGEEVILAFDDNGNPVGLEYDDQGQAVIYDKPTKEVRIQNGERVELGISLSERKRILFDNLNRDTKADPMLLKRPKLKLDQDGKPLKGVDGKPIIEEVEKVHVDFEIATNHIYSGWTGHPYWGYQEEDTGLLLTPENFEAAKRIRSGQSRWEDEEPHATQLLIVDPTLERVAHFRHKESREDKIALAAVEGSYQGHWRIRDELNMAFLPEGPDVETARTAYVIQDFAGSLKELENTSFEAARWANMKVRRGRSLTGVLPLHWDAMSGMWGAPKGKGALNVLRMMNYGMDSGSSYRIVGQFALEKWINQIGGAQDVYDALFGWVSEQEKRSREGYGEKPNNDADSLQKLWENLTRLINNLRNKDVKPSTAENLDNQYVNAVREAMGRPEVTTQRMRVLETDMRGERAPLWLEGIDIFERNEDGSIKVENGQRVYNQRIDGMRDTGSSRHSGSIWFWRMVRWQRSDKPGEGQDLYPDSARYFTPMDQPTIASISLASIRDTVFYDVKKLVTRWEWLLGKIVR